MHETADTSPQQPAAVPRGETLGWGRPYGSFAKTWLPRLILVAAVALAAGAVLRTAPEKNGIYMDQMTFLLQAVSLAQDGDLVYTPHDRERFQALGWGPEPSGLFLRSAAGRHYFAKPAAYSLLAAPFCAVSPNRGPLVLNLLLWAACLWFAFDWLSRWMHPLCAALLAAACYGLSAPFFYLFVIHPDIFIMFLVSAVLWLSLTPFVAREIKGRENRHTLPGAAAGVLLGALCGVLAYEKLPAAVFPAAVLAMWWWRGAWRGAAAAAAVMVAVALAFAAMHYAQDGSLSPYQGRRSVVLESDPFAAPAQPSAPMAGVDSGTFFQPQKMASKYSQDVVVGLVNRLPVSVRHFLAGRKVGMFPYLTPFLVCGVLALAGMRRREERRALWLLVPFALYALFYFAILPTNYHGGPTALGNRYAMQAAPALVFAVAGVATTPTAAWLACAAALLAAVYFPGRLLAAPATAVRDNYLVFQWNRFRHLPLEDELLVQGCDRYDSRTKIAPAMTLLRLSEPDPPQAQSGFWLGANANSRFAVAAAGRPPPAIGVRLSTADCAVKCAVECGRTIVACHLIPGTTRVVNLPVGSVKSLEVGRHRQYAWEFAVRVTRVVETSAPLSVAPGCALHVQLAQPVDGYPAANADGAFDIDPGDPRAASFLLWGWWEASQGDKPERWAGGTTASAVAVPPTGKSTRMLRVEGHSLGSPLGVSARLGNGAAQRFTLHPEETSATVTLRNRVGVEEWTILELRHDEVRVPAQILGDPRGDTRGLTAMYHRLTLDAPGDARTLGTKPAAIQVSPQ